MIIFHKFYRRSCCKLKQISKYGCKIMCSWLPVYKKDNELHCSFINVSGTPEDYVLNKTVQADGYGKT